MRRTWVFATKVKMPILNATTTATKLFFCKVTHVRTHIYIHTYIFITTWFRAQAAFKATKKRQK